MPYLHSLTCTHLSLRCPLTAPPPALVALYLSFSCPHPSPYCPLTSASATTSCPLHHPSPQLGVLSHRPPPAPLLPPHLSSRRFLPAPPLPPFRPSPRLKVPPHRFSKHPLKPLTSCVEVPLHPFPTPAPLLPPYLSLSRLPRCVRMTLSQQRSSADNMSASIRAALEAADRGVGEESYRQGSQQMLQAGLGGNTTCRNGLDIWTC